MPQLVGVTLMLSFFGIAPLILSHRQTIVIGTALGFLLCGLFIGYNELLPITGAVTGLYVLAMARFNRKRWVKILRVSGVMAMTAIVFCPLGVYRGMLGMLFQIKLARSTGGGEQAIKEVFYFVASWIGLLPLPPNQEFVNAVTQNGAYATELRLVAGFLGIALLLLILGLRDSFRGRRLLLPISLCVATGLAIYIEFSFESVRFRTWGQFKLTQYLLPAIALLIGIGVKTSLSRIRPMSRLFGIGLLLALLYQGFDYYRTFPRTLLTANIIPQSGKAPTNVDFDFIHVILYSAVEARLRGGRRWN